MNKGRLFVWLVAATVVIGGAGVASAEHNGATPGARPAAVAPPAQDTDRPALAPSPDMTQDAQQRVVGRVLQLDRERGLVALSTQRGVVVLQGPPEALANVNEGDVVAVTVNSDENIPSASPAEPEAVDE